VRLSCLKEPYIDFKKVFDSTVLQRWGRNKKTNGKLNQEIFGWSWEG